METSKAITSSKALPLHRVELDPLVIPNRIHALVYSCAVFALLYHRTLRLLHPTTIASFVLSLSMLVADALLALMWATNQGFRWRPIRREEFPENLSAIVGDGDLPKLDVFICTADPYKEPPMNVANTALSVLAFDYPAEKVSVYISDDGGSELTLFAIMEAVKFARHWLPFCREKKIQDRCPEVYFKSNSHGCSSELKAMYESMKDKVDGVVERGKVSMDLLATEEERSAFKQWTADFTKQDHPSVIQVLLESEQDMDTGGHKLPNLVYISREKRKTSPHHFKAGALNVLLRVSGVMSNAPVILNLDCDNYANDPQAARRALCYIVDPSMEASRIAYVQFPQRFPGLNESDIYACEYKRMFQINPMGLDGLEGPDYFGTGCFFRRRAFYGPPSLAPHEEWDDMGGKGPMSSIHVLEAAHQVSRCTYEIDTKWGHQVGFRYGSLVEDFFTGYHLVCEGWRSIFCNPKRPAFQGDVPINLEDSLSQNKRWSVGLLEVIFSKYSPFTFGARVLSAPMVMCYAHYSLCPVWAIPIITYAILQPLALLNQVQTFPQVGDAWFYVCVYLFLGAYGQDLFDFVREKGTTKRWWSDQRIWMIRGVSSHLFAVVEFSLQLIGIPSVGFNVTNKVVDEDQNKHYEQGIFEFGVPSSLFVTISTVALLNLIAFIWGIVVSIQRGSIEHMFLQMFISGFVVVNGWPVYEAMTLRKDKGRMPTNVTIMSAFLACAICLMSFILLQS